MELLQALDWTRPHVLFFAGILPLLWWWLRVAPPLEQIATGQLELWRELPGVSARVLSKRGLKTPLFVWWALLGAGLLILGLAGPRWTPQGSKAVLTVWVPGDDALLLDADRPESRLSRALSEVTARSQTLSPRPTAIAWRGAGVPEVLTPPGGQPEPRWFRALSRGDSAGPDGPDVLWVLAEVPRTEPRFAGWIAVGGPAEPGTVGRAGEAGLIWSDGERIELRPDRGPRPRVEAREELARAAAWALPEGGFEAWLSARELAFGPGDGPAVLELVALAPPSEAGWIPVGRDGWTASVRSLPLPAVPRQALQDGDAAIPWLHGPDGAVLAAAGPGVLALAPLEWGPVEGDRTALALSFGRLFDSALAPLPGAGSPRARRALGPPGYRAPRWGSGADGAPWRSAGPAAPRELAALAFLLGAVALFAAHGTYARRRAGPV